MHRFLIDFKWMFHLSWKLRSPKSGIRMTLLALFAFLGKVVFEGLLDSILVPTWPHLGLQNPFKILPKSTENRLKTMSEILYNSLSIFYRFWTRFGPQVGAMLGPCWPQNLQKGDFNPPPPRTPKTKGFLTSFLAL